MPQRGRGEYYVPLFVGAVVLTASALIALSHPFVAPYGLAITGGRAKLWFLAGGVSGDFFSTVRNEFRESSEKNARTGNGSGVFIFLAFHK